MTATLEKVNPQRNLSTRPNKLTTMTTTSQEISQSSTHTYSSVVEYLGISAVRVFATQLPDVEERLPVDVRSQP